MTMIDGTKIPILLALICNFTLAVGGRGYSSDALAAWRQRQETPIQEAALSYLFRTQARKWSKARQIMISPERQPILDNLKRKGYLLTPADKVNEDAAYFWFAADAESPVWKDISHTLLFVRVQHRGAYDFVHHWRGENLWKWATLRLTKQKGHWQVTGLKGKWQHSD